MLSKEENEILTRVGRGTPGGEMLRRYWWPVGFQSWSREKANRRKCACLVRTWCSSATALEISGYWRSIAPTAAPL